MPNASSEQVPHCQKF
ncbi:hypothetical protein INT46_011926, partial [Mucor plumbeus]